MPSRVVIADDHPIFCRGLRGILEREGRFVVVAEARNGAEAIRAIKQFHPAVAILDLSMPGIDGFEVLKQARTWPESPAMVVLTMYDDCVARAFELGALGYLVKENAVDELVQCIDAVLRGERFVSSGIGCRVDQSGTVRAVSSLDALSATEQRVLKLIAELKTSREIGHIMSISYRTVQNHRAHMCVKLGLRGNKALLRFALEHREDVQG